MALLNPLHRYVLAAAVLAAAVLAACDGGSPGVPAPGTVPATASPGAPSPGAAAAFPRAITDSGGASVTIASEPARIISYSPGATEILFAIGAGDRVVAVDEFSDFPPEAGALPKLEYTSPDPERALALDPDLVIMAVQQRGQVEQFRGLGMTVLFVEEAETVEGVLDNITLFGRITGNEVDASALADQLRSRIEAVQTAIADVERGPLVYFELDASLFTAAPDTFVGDLLTLLKARNVAEGAPSRFPQLTAEAIIDADPDVVLLANAEWGESLETVCARPGWAATTACREQRVYPVDPDLTNRPGPRVVDGLEQVAAALYPERFE